MTCYNHSNGIEITLWMHSIVSNFCHLIATVRDFGLVNPTEV